MIAIYEQGTIIKLYIEMDQVEIVKQYLKS